MTCRTCALYDLEATKDKAGRVRRDRVARCGWEPTEPMPASLYGYRTPRLSSMAPDDGEGCPAHQPRPTPPPPCPACAPRSESEYHGAMHTCDRPPPAPA